MTVDHPGSNMIIENSCGYRLKKQKVPHKFSCAICSNNELIIVAKVVIVFPKFLKHIKGEIWARSLAMWTDYYYII